MDRLDGMRAFVSVAELGSFSEAARRADTTPAQISKKVAKLEAYLGARLLDRTTRSVSLTPAGGAYLGAARSILAEVEALEEGVRAAHAEPAGVLRVTAPVAFGQSRFMPLILSFMERHPQVEIQLALNDRMVDLVNEGLDVAVRIGKLEDSSLIARRLAPARLMLAAHPELPGRDAVRHPRDLAEIACVIDANYPTPRRWSFRPRGGGEPVEVRVSGALQVNSGGGAALAGERGHGVVLGPTFCLSDAVRTGRLTPLLPDWEPEHRDIWALYPQRRFLATRVRLFVDHVAEALGPEPAWDQGLFDAA